VISMMVVDCLVIAASAGLVFGLFGSGSGLIMAPGYYYVLRHFELMQDFQMQMAIATTCLATLVLGLSSVYLQHKKKNIDYGLVIRVLPGVVAGSIVAVALLNIIPSLLLKKVFAVVVMLVALWMLIYKQKQGEDNWRLSSIWHVVRTFIMGFLWFSLGVAVFIVPYMYKCGIALRPAVGAASLVATLASGIAAVLFMFSGMHTVGFSADHWGYINVTLFLYAIVPSVIGAYVGAYYSHRLNVNLMKTLYALLIFIVGLFMLL
jgi:uncharacterized membrane protein YfcA